VRRPELYLHAMNYVFFALYAASLVLLGRVALATTGSLAGASAAQLTPPLRRRSRHTSPA